MRVLWTQYNFQSERWNQAEARIECYRYIEDRVYFEKQLEYYMRERRYDQPWRIMKLNNPAYPWSTFETFLTSNAIIPKIVEYTIFDTVEQFAEEHAVEFL